MEIAIIITGIIQVITLIVFFVMAANLASIKNNLYYEDPPVSKYMRMADEEIYIGDKQKAKEYLLRAKYYCMIVYKTYVRVNVNGEWINRGEVIANIDEKIAGL